MSLQIVEQRNAADGKENQLRDQLTLMLSTEPADFSKELTAEELLCAEAVHEARLKFGAMARHLDCLNKLKEKVVVHLQLFENLLVQVDKKMLHERICLVNLLRYVGSGIEEREMRIRDQLAKIAFLEMEKSRDEDALQE